MKKDKAKASPSPGFEAKAGESGSCLSLIGLPGSGKSTLAWALSRTIQWAWVDTEQIMEAWFGIPLEEIRNRLGMSAFYRAEEQIVLDLRVRRCIIAANSRIALNQRIVHFLQKIGNIVYLQVDPRELEQRAGPQNWPNFALHPGQTLKDVCDEHDRLLVRHAQLTLRTDLISPEDCLQEILERLYEQKDETPSSRRPLQPT